MAVHGILEVNELLNEYSLEELKRNEIDNNIIENYKFDTLVLGSAFIRNNRLFSYLASRNKEVYLLLNNGCSFNCTTCNNVGTVCSYFFKENLKKHSLATFISFAFSSSICPTANVLAASP